MELVERSKIVPLFRKLPARSPSPVQTWVTSTGPGSDRKTMSLDWPTSATFATCVSASMPKAMAALVVAFVDPASGGSSGIYLASLFDRLGIADRIRPKAVLMLSGLVATRVVSGEAGLALNQISEILVMPGARLAGPIPADLQMYTVYAGAIDAAA